MGDMQKGFLQLNERSITAIVVFFIGKRTDFCFNANDFNTFVVV